MSWRAIRWNTELTTGNSLATALFTKNKGTLTVFSPFSQETTSSITVINEIINKKNLFILSPNLYNVHIDFNIEREYMSTTNLKNFKLGLLTGSSIAIGYIPLGVSFGIFSKNSGMNSLLSFFMSLVNYAGASQFISTKLMFDGTSRIFEIILAVIILNSRYQYIAMPVPVILQDHYDKQWILEHVNGNKMKQ